VQAVEEATLRVFDPPDTRPVTASRVARTMSRWAIGGRPDARVLNPACGDPVFLEAAEIELTRLGATKTQTNAQLTGIDADPQALERVRALIAGPGGCSQLLLSDFFDLLTPAQIGSSVDWQDAVIGNPPFERYRTSAVLARKRALAATLAHGVRLSGLPSSWAPMLVHAAAFLKPDGRLAMLLPEELLSVAYAEPLRTWLLRRFRRVVLAGFKQGLVTNTGQRMVVLAAQGAGPCDAFDCTWLERLEDLTPSTLDGDVRVRRPLSSPRWTELALSPRLRDVRAQLVADRAVRLDSYGTLELGTVTGANSYFVLSETTRRAYEIDPSQLLPTAPPRVRHLIGARYTWADWERLRRAGEPVWLFYPRDPDAPGVRAYLKRGEDLSVPEAYRCQIRAPWWRVPVVLAPDVFITYLSHRSPRLATNQAGATLVNSLHGLRLAPDTSDEIRDALPIVFLNSLTLLSAEIEGRACSGGALKLEPGMAAALPLPESSALLEAWQRLRPVRDDLEERLRTGRAQTVVDTVDRVLLREVLTLDRELVEELVHGLQEARARRADLSGLRATAG
jgi:adenine-specific DNA-methyltransferase